MTLAMTLAMTLTLTLVVTKGFSFAHKLQLETSAGPTLFVWVRKGAQFKLVPRGRVFFARGAHPNPDSSSELTRLKPFVHSIGPDMCVSPFLFSFSLKEQILG